EVPDAGEVLVSEGRVDEGVGPRAMSRGPVADDGAELAELQAEPAVVPRREAQRVFVEANLGVLVAGIVATIHARLREDVDVRAELRIEKKREARIEEIVLVRANHAGRGQLKVVLLEVDRAAEARPQLI